MVHMVLFSEFEKGIHKGYSHWLIIWDNQPWLNRWFLKMTHWFTPNVNPTISHSRPALSEALWTISSAFLAALLTTHGKHQCHGLIPVRLLLHRGYAQSSKCYMHWSMDLGSTIGFHMSLSMAARCCKYHDEFRLIGRDGQLIPWTSSWAEPALGGYEHEWIFMCTSYTSETCSTVRNETCDRWKWWQSKKGLIERQCRHVRGGLPSFVCVTRGISRC